ncbi:MAG TPA: phytanoyl-CoA dioxygenase family protein [Bacteroidia bacterium]|nr:phytanoyl-CoA dioxygenase family protein [Bacteroidia bacterium]
MIIADEIKFAKDQIDSPELITALHKYGTVLVDSFYNVEVVTRLNSEFDQFLQNREPYIIKLDYSNGRAIKFLISELDSNLYPETYRTFKASFMDELVRTYLGVDMKANISVFAVNDVVGSKHHANDLHFDVQRSLKFFIYLTDTMVENGAFFCAPGSNAAAAALRKKYGSAISYENRELSRELPVNEEDVIPLEGKAGTLIIFDTDVFHRAGKVHRGERRVLRGQSSYVPIPGKKPSLLKRIFG